MKKNILALMFFSLILFISACDITIVANDGKITNEGAISSTTGENQIETDGIIANHNCIDLNLVPIADINTASNDLKIAYWHTSHGSQITTGMAGLTDFAGDEYDYADYDSDDALYLLESGDDLGSGSGDWDNTTSTYLDAHTEINVVMWSWCGGASSASESDITSYLSKMTALEESYSNVTFIYMTGHLDGTGLTGTLNLNNERIRDYCINNDKVLFDFADIESYDPDGNYYLDRMGTDGCYYDSDNDGQMESFEGNPGEDANWALEWQESHTEDVDWYQCSSAHSVALNANMKAYAAWWMFARIAGWDGVIE